MADSASGSTLSATSSMRWGGRCGPTASRRRARRSRSSCPARDPRRGRPGRRTEMTSPAYVLLVDDDADIREAASLVLEGAGYEVQTAVDGVEALDRARAARPGLILL